MQIALTWQDWLLISVSTIVFAIVIGGVIYALLQVVKLLKEVREFMVDLAREVGTDSGKSLATRLHIQDTMLEDARVLAERKVGTDAIIEQAATKATTDLRALVRDLESTVVRMNENRVMWERYMELLQQSTSKDIITTVNQAAQSPTNTLSLAENARLGQGAVGDSLEQENIKTGDKVIIAIEKKEQ